MSKLGDTHNFGKSVSEVGGMIFKPRTLIWEYIFLSPHSELRKKLENLARIEGVNCPFSLFPQTGFDFNKKNSFGYVDKIIPSTFEVKDLSSDEVNKIGSFCALCFWFGIGDLHFENVLIGRSEFGSLICAPIDIECIFDNLVNIKQTLLIESKNINLNNAGIGKLISIIDKKDLNIKNRFLVSFAKYLNFLNSNILQIYSCIKSEIVGYNSEIRIIFRNTQDYFDWSKSKKDKSFKKDEIKQLNRGDIPYFFRSPTKCEIYYLSSANTMSRTKIKPIEFNLPTPVRINKKSFLMLFKTTSALFSISNLANSISLNFKMTSLSKIIVNYHNSYSLEFYIKDNLIVYE